VYIAARISQVVAGSSLVGSSSRLLNFCKIVVFAGLLVLLLFIRSSAVQASHLHHCVLWRRAAAVRMSALTTACLTLTYICNHLITLNCCALLKIGQHLPMLSSEVECIVFLRHSTVCSTFCSFR